MVAASHFLKSLHQKTYQGAVNAAFPCTRFRDCPSKMMLLAIVSPFLRFLTNTEFSTFLHWNEKKERKKESREVEEKGREKERRGGGGGDDESYQERQVENCRPWQFQGRLPKPFLVWQPQLVLGQIPIILWKHRLFCITYNGMKLLGVSSCLNCSSKIHLKSPVLP